MSQTADSFYQALALFDGVVDAVPGDRWDAPSPCEGWSATAVVGHMAGGLDMIAEVIEAGAMVPPPRTDPLVLAGSDPVKTWQSRYQQALASRPHLNLDATIDTPQGPLTVADGLRRIAIEPLVHAWDLAQAAGVPFTMPDELVLPMLAAIEPAADALQAAGGFGERVPVASGAAPSERLLALLGRKAPAGGDA